MRRISINAIVMIIIAVICVCMKERDVQAMILIVSLGIYTLVEATFVTRYLGREERGGIDEYDIMMDDIISGRVKGDDPRLQ